MACTSTALSRDRGELCAMPVLLTRTATFSRGSISVVYVNDFWKRVLVSVVILWLSRFVPWEMWSPNTDRGKEGLRTRS